MIYEIKILEFLYKKMYFISKSKKKYYFSLILMIFDLILNFRIGKIKY
jgi:hypothetical protein